MSDASFLSWPFFESSHRAFAAALENWSTNGLAELCGGDAHGAAMDETVRRLVRALGAAGFLKACIPAAYGGRAETFDVRGLCLAREILGRRDGLADFAFAMQGLGSGAITLFGDAEQKARFLPAVGRGEAIAAFAISEPDAGSDVGAMSTNAVRDGDDYVIDGAKTWISNAGLADFYTVFARVGDDPGAKGISAFIVEATTPGLSVSERIDVIAPHPLGALKFSNCRVPAANMLSKPGDGFKIAMSVLDVFRSTVGAAALGFARRALDEAAQRALNRRVFGKPLADFQLTQAKIADMAVAIDASALLIYRAAWVKDSSGARVTREASMAKLFATEEAQKVIDAAVQIFGGTGVVSGVTVETLYREIRALRIYEGASEIQKLVIAGKVLEAYKPQE
ncbi:acyl-CoA dehydrogenase [Rhodoblastus sphagnicola]|uniref:Acyl-CoA dehydrogenase n=1 Tax=Rhodoblastus sphagnicola TaxID=333368 RepID=A0A2S6MX32_9HYPH|nr:acyl-CoA dehydrogenase family protein [Rhodoblastus sphagnicola]MBB4199245.1 acyl-CoA dehydrogenase [Rhodoblastus sphagnicola]PPQ26916.1 acyl-CoA dehydrogenase [Rhodoblastus sphagnicola]